MLYATAYKGEALLAKQCVQSSDVAHHCCTLTYIRNRKTRMTQRWKGTKQNEALTNNKIRDHRLHGMARYETTALD